MDIGLSFHDVHASAGGMKDMLDPMPFDSASIELKDLTAEASTFLYG